MNVTFVGKYYTLLYTHSLHVHQILSCKIVCKRESALARVHVCVYECCFVFMLYVEHCKMSRKLWLAFIKRSENVTPNNMVFCAHQVYDTRTPVAKNNI